MNIFCLVNDFDWNGMTSSMDSHSLLNSCFFVHKDNVARFKL